MAAFLLQKVRQCGRNAVEHALDVEVDHAIPLVDLEKRKRRDRHDAGIVHQDVDLAIGVDGLVDQGLDFGPLRCVYCNSERLSTAGLNVSDNRVETILTSRAQNNCSAQFCEVPSGALSETAARTRDDYDLAFNVPAHVYLLVVAR